MSAQLLLCTDLDRTLLPNGREPESRNARALFERLVGQSGVVLAYVTGRSLKLVHKAIKSFGLPEPDYAITDVGSRIHEIREQQWSVWPDWEAEIAPDWNGVGHDELHRLFRDLKVLRLQQKRKQNTYKLSYYVPIQTDIQALMAIMTARTMELEINASIIWSIDEPSSVGLLDVLPARATKLHAIEFLRQRLGLSHNQTLFAGDSGNDLPVLASAVPSVLVANASVDVQKAALAQAREYGNSEHLYLARGGVLDMNGNYAGGILEGVRHYHPAFIERLNNELSTNSG